jgi:hypothetical protein
VDLLLGLLGIRARLDLSLEMVQYNGRLIVTVTLSKGPCHIWWAYEDDKEGGPPDVWLKNIHELMAYWQRCQDMIRDLGLEDLTYSEQAANIHLHGNAQQGRTRP